MVFSCIVTVRKKKHYYYITLPKKTCDATKLKADQDVKITIEPLYETQKKKENGEGMITLGGKD